MSVTLPGAGSIVETTTQTGGQRQVISIGDFQTGVSVSGTIQATQSGTWAVTQSGAWTATISNPSLNYSLESAGNLQKVADLLTSMLEELRIMTMVISSLNQPNPETPFGMRGDPTLIDTN